MVLSFEHNEKGFGKDNYGYRGLKHLILSGLYSVKQQRTHVKYFFFMPRTTTIRNINAHCDIDERLVNLKYFSQLFSRNTINSILLVLHTMCPHNV